MSFSRVLSLLLLATVSVREAQASKHTTPNRADHKLRAEQLTKKQSTTYNLIDEASGATFFDKWNFMTFDDPTHGTVTYVDADTAFSQGLAYVRPDGVAVMKVDNTTQLQEGEKRNSVRIHTKNKYGHGLFIADILQMPYGCSVWPAYWSNGDNWPAGGEIDVIEGTQNSTSNQSTLHTLPGCTLDASRQDNNGAQLVSDSTFTGVVKTTTCDASVDFNSGCGIENPDPSSYGFGLNLAGGGVYATLWTDDGIRIWFFPRANIPEDIANKTPNPDSWPAPSAFFSTSSCPMSQFFTDQTFIFNITLCGDLANATFNQGGCPGTCSQWVTDPANFRTAMWKVKSFIVYQQGTQ